MLSCAQLCKTRAEDVFVSKELLVCDGTPQLDTTGHGEQAAGTG